MNSSAPWMLGLDLGRLCFELAQSSNEEELAELTIAFFAEQKTTLEQMVIFLFDEEFAPICKAHWPPQKSAESQTLLDYAIDSGAVAEAMQHGRYAVEHPSNGALMLRALGTGGRDIGLFLALAKNVSTCSQPRIDGILSPALAILSQTIENTRLQQAALKQADALQKAVDERTEELTSALQASQSAERSKSTFLATMSHEIRTPLNGILGILDLLNGQLTSPDHNRLIETGRNCSQHLLSLLNDILDMAKIDAGRIELQEEPFHIATEAESILTILSAHERIRSKQVTLSLDAQLGEERSYHGDHIHLRQILFNLLGNALKFTKKGTVSLSIQPISEPNQSNQGNHDETGQWMQFQVRDSGIGISQEDLKELFNPFQQVGKNTHQQYGGTGLGLAISQRLASLMGGTLSVESELGRGSCFTLEIPLRHSTNRVPRQPHVAEQNAEDEQLLKGLRVLAVEDNSVNRIILKRMLERLGCLNAMVDNGIEALRLYKIQRPEIILTDIEMPQLDGYGLAAQIREHELSHGLPRLPIIALSAHTFTEHQQKAQDNGIDAYIAKPITLKDLKTGLLATLRAASKGS